MCYKIFWLPQAEEDYAKLSNREKEIVMARIDLLATFPFMGPAMWGAYRGFRCLLAGSYKIIYRVFGKEVEIAYIRHQKRQIRLRVIRGEE